MMKIKISGLIAGITIAGILSSCRNRAPVENLPATLVWGTNQTSIEPVSGRMNVWGGFTIQEDSFQAEQRTARFILWRTAKTSEDVRILYALTGRAVDFKANGKIKGSLQPQDQAREARFKVEFNSGFNFLEFNKSARDVLKIFSIRIGDAADRPAHHLREGDSLTLFNEKGRGFVELRGKGELTITETSFPEGREVSRKTSRRTRFWSRRIKHDFSHDGPGLVNLAVKSGRFDVVGYSLIPAPAESEETGKTIRFSGNPDIFIFLIDACQAKHLGVYGYERPTSPHIDRFAKDAVVFENAYCNATFTRSSVATLFTGLYPESHQVRILQSRLPKRLLTIPAYLKAKGYRTSLFTATGNVSISSGFTRGVDDYFAFIGAWNRRDEKLIPSRFRQWLPSEGPRFSYVHFMEPHLPIVPPPPFLDMFADAKSAGFSRRVMSQLTQNIREGRSFSSEEIRAVINNYDSTIAYIDGELEKLLQALREKDLYDESLIIILSDHGESMYEHGRWGHGHVVFEDTAHVPLLVKFPASLNLKGRVKTVVQLVDVFPTLADLFEQEMLMDGKSLLEALRVRDIDESLAVSRSFSAEGSYGLRWRQWYEIINVNTGLETLFLQGDPFFRKLEDPPPGIRLLFRALFLNWLKKFSETDGDAARASLRTLPKNELENLKSLGYLK